VQQAQAQARAQAHAHAQEQAHAQAQALCDVRYTLPLCDVRKCAVRCMMCDV
jgi:hypothetical protein